MSQFSRELTHSVVKSDDSTLSVTLGRFTGLSVIIHVSKKETGGSNNRGGDDEARGGVSENNGGVTAGDNNNGSLSTEDGVMQRKGKPDGGKGVYVGLGLMNMYIIFPDFACTRGDKSVMSVYR